MVFLVLDHNEPNPLFRAPIGNEPKVNRIKCAARQWKTNYHPEHSRYWNWSRQLGNVSSLDVFPLFLRQALTGT